MVYDVYCFMEKEAQTEKETVLKRCQMDHLRGLKTHFERAKDFSRVLNALLLFKAGTKSGDFHENMNNNNYTKWLRNQLIPNLPPNAVLLIDNTSYHNKQYDPAPTSNAKKADMQRWLTEKGIAYEESMLKPQL
ncbi:unnamed protein product [Colias eurytheme]|nr:unnamed protein product [Colias eurytheme]